MDRLQKILKGWEVFHKADTLTLAQAMSDIVWLANEVERLRRIEDAAMDWMNDLADEPNDEMGEALVNSLINNEKPRPCDD